MPLFRDGECEPLRRWHEAAQIVGFAACALLVNLVIGLLIKPLGFTGAREINQGLIELHGKSFAFFMIVIVAPFTETIYIQWLPLMVSKIARRKPIVQILWASCWCSLMHIPQGFAYILQNFGVGWVLASCFLFCRKEEWLKAYRVTSIAHVIHNLTIYIISYSM